MREISGGVKAEQIIHRGRLFQPALVPVPPDAREPPGIHHAGAVHPQGFFLQVTHAGTFGVGAVTKVAPGLHAAQVTHRGHHPAKELQVIVTVENVVFAVVLVVQHQLRLRQAGAEVLAGVGSGFGGGVGVPAPVHEHFGEVGVGLPVSFLNQIQNARAVRAGRTAEHAVHGAGLGLLGRQVSKAAFQFGQVMLAREVVLRVFVGVHGQRKSLVQQRDQVREGVPEKAADPHRHIDARAAQFVQGHQLHVFQAAALRVPHGFHAQQREDLRQVIPLCPHVACPPHADGDVFGVLPFRFLQVAFQHFTRQVLPDRPGHL